MKKFLSWFLVVAITAALAVGGTMAYLTDTDDDVNVMTIGNVKIQQIEQERVDPETSGPDAALQDFQNDKPLYPAVLEPGFQWDTNGIDFWDPSKINNEQDKIVSVKNTGDYDAFVRTVFAFEAGGYTWEQFQEKLHLNINENDWSWEWIQEPVIIGDSAFFLATATYNTPLAPGQITPPQSDSGGAGFLRRKRGSSGFWPGLSGADRFSGHSGRRLYRAQDRSGGRLLCGHTPAAPLL